MAAPLHSRNRLWEGLENPGAAAFFAARGQASFVVVND
jgi:hypothetical protein